MRIVDLNTAPREEWRKGVLTRMRVSAANGGTQLLLSSSGASPAMARRRICMRWRKYCMC